MRFMLSALRRSVERRFLKAQLGLFVIWAGCYFLSTFVDPSSYRNPGLTEFIVAYQPYLMVFLFFGNGIEQELKARRAEKYSKEKNDE